MQFVLRSGEEVSWKLSCPYKNEHDTEAHILSCYINALQGQSSGLLSHIFVPTCFLIFRTYFWNLPCLLFSANFSNVLKFCFFPSFKKNLYNSRVACSGSSSFKTGWESSSFNPISLKRKIDQVYFLATVCKGYFGGCILRPNGEFMFLTILIPLFWTLARNKVGHYKYIILILTLYL